MTPMPVIDLAPKRIAEALDALVRATLETDREVAAILAPARESLRALDWNRSADLHHRRSRARVLRRRHQGRAAFIACHQMRQGGRNHA